MKQDYTTVLGVDRRHMRQLEWTWPTWARHKPSLLERPLLIFYDRGETYDDRIRRIVLHPHLITAAWPPYEQSLDWGQPTGQRWDDPQRVKMLSGFVHVPAIHATTPYVLKLDLDVVATGRDDWVDPAWFAGQPAIVAHAWTFTKPPDQMDRLDEWAERSRLAFPQPVLNMHPTPGSDRLGHRRIISWCGFFRTDVVRLAAELARRTCPHWRLPVNSQDGYLWYLAKRLGLPIVRPNMRRLGWAQWHTDENVRTHAEEAMR